MANFVLAVLYISCVLVIKEVRTESIIEILFSRLSDRIDRLDRAFEVKLDNSVAEINNRLDKIEKVIGIKEHDSEDADDDILRGISEGQTMWADIRNAKHTFMKAMVTEKKQLRKFANDCEKKFSELKNDVKDILNGMNGSITEPKESMIGMIEQNNHTCNEQIRHVLSEIHSVASNATIERDNLKLEILILEDKISKNESQQDSRIETLEGRVSLLNSSAESDRSSLVTIIKSLYHAVSTLSEQKVGFTAELSSTRSYSKGRVIVFDNRVHNYDDNYDTRSGKFTAPKSGTYLFSMSVEGTHNKAANAAFKTGFNSKSYVRMNAYANKDGDTGSNTCVVYLREGEQAWVESFIDGGYLLARTSFSGVLIG